MNAPGNLTDVAVRLQRGRCVLCVSGRLDTRHSFRTVVEELLRSLPGVDWKSASRVLDVSPFSAAAYVRRHMGDEFLPALVRATTTAEVPETIQLLSELPFRAFVTTSWGQALEHSTSRVPVCTPGDLFFHGHERHILKLLGQPQEPETLIWTAQDVASGLADPERRAVLQDVYDGSSFLLLGYSSMDPDFRLVLEHVVTSAGQDDAEHYAILTEVSDIEREELETVYGIRVIIEDSALHGARALCAALGSVPRARTKKLPAASERIEALLARLEEEPDQQSTLLELGQLETMLRQAGDYEHLVDLYVGRIGIEPNPKDRADLLRELARILEREMNDLERAFRAQLASYELVPRRAAWPELERLAAATGLWDELLQALNQTLTELGPVERVDTLVHMAMLYDEKLDHGDYALSSLDMAIELDPEREAAHATRLALLRRCERWDELIDALEKRALMADSAVVRSDRFVELADLYESRLNDPAQALAYYRQALENDPWSPDGRLAYEALLRRRGNHAELVQSLEQRLYQAPLEEQVAIRKEIAVLCDENLGDVTRAIRYYEDLRADAPADIDVLRALARLYEQQGCIKEQLGVLAAELGVVEENAQRAELCLQMASQWQKLGSEDQVQESLEWVLAYGGRHHEVFETLAQMYRANGHWRAAIDVYCRHADTSTAAERARLYCEVARIYEKELGDASSAIDFYVKAIRGVPEDVEAFSALARLYEQREFYEDVVDVLERQAAYVDPATRVTLFHRAGEISLSHLDDDVTAELFFERALVVQVAHVPSMRGLVSIYRKHSEFVKASEIIDRAIATAPAGKSAVALYMEAGDIREALGERDKAVACYREVLRREPTHVEAAERLAEALWQAERFEEAALLLQMLTIKEPEHPSHIERLVRLGRAQAALGHAGRAEQALAEAIRLEPQNLDALAAYVEFSAKQGKHARALEHLRAMAEHHEATLPPARYIELHHQWAELALKLGDQAEAREHVRLALARDPRHQPSLVLSLELDDVDPEEAISIKTMLLEAATSDAERAALLADIGEIYFEELRDAPRALEALRRAHDHQPQNHLILHLCLDVLMAKGDWEQSVAVLAELISSENDPAVRAKYRFAAAMLLLEEMHDEQAALQVLKRALEDDPFLVRASAALESVLTEREDWKALGEHYLSVIQHLGPKADDGKNDERLRLWSALGKLCLTRLADRDGALCAYEVAVDLDSANLEYRQTLAKLYIESGSSYLDKAIAAHQDLLRMDKQGLAHYQTLEGLYAQAGQEDKGAFCAEARKLIELRAAGNLPRASSELPHDLAGPALSAAMWARIRHPEQDRRLSTLFALVAPVLAAMQARSPAQLGLSEADRIAADDRRRFTQILRHAAGTLAIAVPDTYASRERTQAVRVVHCVTAKGPQPALVLSEEITTGSSERDVLFHLTRQLATLQPELMIQHFVVNPKQLAQIIDAAIALSAKADGGQPASSNAVTHTAATIAGCLLPVALDHVIALGRELGAEALRSEEAAAAWLRAADHTASRAALVVSGDLATCMRLLAAEPVHAAQAPAAERVMELAWSSATEEICAVRKYLGRKVDSYAVEQLRASSRDAEAIAVV